MSPVVRLLRTVQTGKAFLISNFRRHLNVLCFLLSNSPASEFYMPTFRNTLFHHHRQVGAYLPMKMEQSVLKRRHIKFRRRGITQEKAYNRKGTVGESTELEIGKLVCSNRAAQHGSED